MKIAARKPIVRKVLSNDFRKFGKLSRLFMKASKTAPSAPIPLDSVGVAMPKKIDPNTSMIRNAAGKIAMSI